jgi:pilus assembly protein CpaB
LSRRLRIGILVLLVGLGLAVVGFLALTTIVRQSFAPVVLPTPVAPLTERVVVVSHDVAIGDLLRAEDMRLVDVPVELASPGAIREIETAIGRITKVQLVTGEMVMQHNLADPTNVNHDLAYIIDDNQVLMAFPPNDLMSSLGVLQRGDLIDIFVSITQDAPVVEEERLGGEVVLEGVTETRLFTLDAFQRVNITALVVDIIQEEQQGITVTGPGATPQPQPTPSPGQIKIKAYLLALSPQDALLLKHLKDTEAVFDFVLRSPTSNQIFDALPVTSDYVIDRYQLEVRKK